MSKSKRIALICFILCILLLSACGTKTVNNPKDNPALANPSDNTDELSGEKSGSKDKKPAVAESPVKVSAYEGLFKNGPIRAKGQNDLWGYLDKSGNWAVEPTFKTCRKFVDGLALAKDTETDLWGFIDKKGRWEIKPAYTELYGFHDGLAAAKDPDSGKWGFINQKGNWEIVPQYALVSSFREGLSVAYDWYSEKCGYIDSKGNTVIPFQFAAGSDFCDDRAFVMLSDGDSAYGPNGLAYISMIDKKSDVLAGLYPYLPRLLGEEEDAEGWVEWNYNYLLIGDSEFYEHLEFCEEYNSAVSPEQWCSSCVMDKQGSVVFQGTDYDHDFFIYQILNDRGELYVYDYRSGLYGIVDLNGEWVAGPAESIRIYTDEVHIGHRETRLSDQGFEYSLIVEDEVKAIKGIGGDKPPFSINIESLLNSLRYVSESVDGQYKCGYNDSDGNAVIACIFDSLEPAEDWSYFKAKYEGLWGILDRTGDWLIKPEFQSIVLE